MVSTTSLGRAALLGIGTGIRSMTPVTLTARAASNGLLPLKGERPFDVLTRPHVADLLTVALIGEDVADKLPFTPKRTDIGPLIGRMIFGAGVAGAAAAGEGESIPLATGVGALGAAWGSFAATGARLSLAERGIPSPLVGLLEDVLAMALTAAALGKRIGTIV
jgi:uncharacterized membrane protein